MPSSFEDYDVLYTIGSGSYGTCKKIRRKRDGRILVWKEIDYGSMTETEKQMLVSEVNLLRELKHQHIVRYYDRIIDRSKMKIYIVMEYCEGGDLASLIEKCRKENHYLEEDFIWKILVQVLLALKECHRRKGGRAVLHRDLKPANVFLDSTKNVKLGDFGLARVLHHETSFAKTFVGTPYYMSPEQMNYMSYNEKSDIWSFGCMIYELCSLHPPFTAKNQKELAVKIKIGRFVRIPSQYSDELNRVISSMLRVDGDRRPSIDEMLNNPMVTAKMNRQPLGSTPSNDTKDSLTRREEQLRLEQRNLEREKWDLESRKKDLAMKERQLEKKEASVAVKERLAEEKMQRAESLRKEYSDKLLNFNIRDKVHTPDLDNDYKPLPSCISKPRPEGSPKKHVTFRENKENLDLDLDSLDFKADPESHNFKDFDALVDYRPQYKREVNMGVGRFDIGGDYNNDYRKRLDLRERLKRAKERSRALRDAELESKYRSRQLLGMR